MIWLFLSVVVVCAAGIYAQNRQLAQKAWVGRTEYDLVVQQLSATQKAVAALATGLRKIAVRQGLVSLVEPAEEKKG